MGQVTQPDLGQIAAVLHPVAMGDAFLHLHPAFRTAELEAEMIAFAERHLSVRGKEGQRRLTILADQNDALRQRILRDRGYASRGRFVNRWWRDLDAPFPDLIPMSPRTTSQVIIPGSER